MADEAKNTLRFEYDVKTSDLWQVSMYYAWSSYLKIINICCIVASIALFIKVFPTAGPLMRVLIILFFMLFTVIQPLYIYMKADRQLGDKKQHIVLELSDDAFVIMSGGGRQIKKWDEICAFVVKPTLIVIYSSVGEGYILTNKVLGEKKGELKELLEGKVRGKKR